MPLLADKGCEREMRVEVSDSRLIPDLRRYLQRNGCPSEPCGDDVFEVRVLWNADVARTDSLERAKVFTHLREWLATHPGVQANLLS
jgi:hypothetical protein